MSRYSEMCLPIKLSANRRATGALKGAIEEWFVSNKSLYIYFVAIFVTAWAVLIPSTKIAWRVFKDLPEPPTELKQALNYTD